MRLKFALLGFILLIWQIVQVAPIAKFTNVMCLSLDENFTDFTVCRLRAVKRDVIELTLHAKILTKPKKPLVMRWQLLKRANGYKPFLYDVTIPDLCEYLEKRNHPFVNIIFNSFANRTNVVKCPLKDEFTLDNFRFPMTALNMLPLPSGDYGIFATISYDNSERILVKTFFTIMEDIQNILST